MTNNRLSILAAVLPITLLCLPTAVMAQDEAAEEPAAEAIAQPAAEAPTVPETPAPQESAEEIAEADSQPAAQPQPSSEAPAAADVQPAAQPEPAPAPEAPTVKHDLAEPQSGMAAVAVTVPPSADGAIKRGRFYFGMGLGLGASQLSDNSVGNTPAASTVNIRTGGIINDRYLVGVQAVLLGQYFAWEEKTTTGAMMSSLMVEGMYFPMADSPLNISLGAGWGSAVKLQRIANTRKGDAKVISASGNGLSWLAAVGWDFYPGVGTNLGLQLRYEGTQSENLGTDHAAFMGFWLHFYSAPIATLVPV